MIYLCLNTKACIMSKYKSDRVIINSSDHNLTFHPYNIMLVLALAGITMLFLSITVAFIFDRVHHPEVPPIKVPLLFVFNTFVLLASSYSLIQSKKYYIEDNTETYKKFLILTIILTLIFLFLQIVAWYLLFNNNISLTFNNLASYLYVLSALHFVHVIAGIPFLISFYINACNKMKEPVGVLIYFSDPFKKLRLRILTLYWHYLDILWIYLVIFLLVNQFIK